MKLAFTRAMLGAVVALPLAFGWLTPPSAVALETKVDAAGDTVVVVPAVTGATSVWIDVEAPGLVATDLDLSLAGQPVTLRTTPLGVGAIVAYPGATHLSIAVVADAEITADVAITVVDGSGRVLLSDGARLLLGGAGGEPQPSPGPNPDPQPSPNPTSGPNPTAGPTDPSGPTSRPTDPKTRPGLPDTGADASAAYAVSHTQNGSRA